ncbi:hypothetical protein ACQKWADRAFT_292220 [Trichoderma austrokoningii]
MPRSAASHGRSSASQLVASLTTGPLPLCLQMQCHRLICRQHLHTIRKKKQLRVQHLSLSLGCQQNQAKPVQLHAGAWLAAAASPRLRDGFREPKFHKSWIPSRGRGWTRGSMWPLCLSFFFFRFAFPDGAPLSPWLISAVKPPKSKARL